MRWMRSLTWRHYVVLGVVAAGTLAIVTLQKGKDSSSDKSRWISGNGKADRPMVAELGSTQPNGSAAKQKSEAGLPGGVVGMSGKGFLGQGCTAAEYRGAG